MDFSFLNALTRATTLPPPEPWFAGSPLYYSYFGYYEVAALGKTLHLDPALTFNLGIALMAGLTAAAAFAVGAAVAGQWQTGVLAAFFVALIGNLAGPRELMGPHKIVNFDYFWATSRVIHDTINEFPLWSFLFADLHAHVMVMPISLTFLGLTVMWLRLRVIHPHQPRPAGTTLVLLALLCLALGRHYRHQHLERADLHPVLALPLRHRVADRGRGARLVAIRVGRRQSAWCSRARRSSAGRMCCSCRSSCTSLRRNATGVGSAARWSRRRIS